MEGIEKNVKQYGSVNLTPSGKSGGLINGIHIGQHLFEHIPLFIEIHRDCPHLKK